MSDATSATSGCTHQEKTLDNFLVGGIAWTGGVKWFLQLLRWSSTLVVARLLTPDDFGLVGMATVYLGLVEMIMEFGLGSTIVMVKDLDTEAVAQINSLAVLLGIGCFLLSFGLAFPLALFFKTPLLRWVVVVMSISFVISAFKTVPYALLQKDLRFKFLAIAEGIQGLVQSLSMVFLALMGYGYWTLTIGWLIGATLSTGLICSRRMHHFSRPRFSSLRDALAFSRDVLVSRIAWYTYSNADFLAAGRLLGQASLGDYTLAWTLANIPIDKVSALIGQVTPPIFSAVQTDPAALRRYVLSITEGLCLITFPLACGLGLVAEDFVILAMGQHWRGVVVPLQILAMYATFRSIVPLVNQVLFVCGESRLVRRNNVVAALVMPVSFVMGSHWGTWGIALAWVLVYPFIAFLPYKRLFERIDLPVSSYLQSLWPACTSVIGMAAGVLLAKLSLLSDPGLRVSFALQVFLGAAGYFLTVGLFYRSIVQRFWQLITSIRS